jgi:hypothetical protein
MQTPEQTEASSPRRRGWIALAAAAVLVVATAGTTYAVTRSDEPTKTVVKTVATPAAATSTTGRNCIPGAAPGSCNTDEFVESKIPDVPLSTSTHTLLASQLVEARAAAMRYPTVADAERAGMIPAGGFSPETGAHFINIRDALATFDPAHPGSYIYDGIAPTSKVIGLMYLSGAAVPPAGFAGPNDHWHRHSNTCVEFRAGKIVVPFAADSDVTQAQCDALHGDFMKRTTWMVHAWVVPGWESPLGVFAHNNPDVVCANGTIKTDAVGFCKGT